MCDVQLGCVSLRCCSTKDSITVFERERARTCIRTSSVTLVPLSNRKRHYLRARGGRNRNPPPAMSARAERQPPRKPGRPATYVFDKPDAELTEAERKLKLSIEKRRLRQNRSYHRRKALRLAAQQAKEKSDAPQSQSQNESFSEGVVPTLDAIDKENQNILSGASSNAYPASSSSSRGRVEELDVASLAQRWKLPKLTTHPVLSPNLGLTLESSASASPGQANSLDLSQQGLMDVAAVPDVSGDILGTEEDDGTDALVQNALAVAQQANSSKATVPQLADLRDNMEQQRNLLRMSGIKDLVFENLRTQFLGMPTEVQSAMRHLVIFPCSFDAPAAVYIANSDPFGVSEMLQSLVGTSFLQPCGKGRFQLNDTVRMFMREDPTVLAMDTANSYQSAMTRFCEYFRTQLDAFRSENIHKVGWQREKAMLCYDSERANMQFAEFLSQRNSGEMLRDFLAAGITVMRYCVSASEREIILRRALDDEVSTEKSVPLNGQTTYLFPTDDPALEAAKSRDLANTVRLQLALAEALFDQLKVDEAEVALLKALKLMGGDSEAGTGPTGMNNAFYAASGSDDTVRVVDSVLVLLLLSNVRMSRNRVREARTLCVKALRILAAAGLGRSTFGINAMSNLTAIYLEENQLDKAGVVATRLVDTLNNMGYQQMPIFADALGVLGSVNNAKGLHCEAALQFGSALEIVRQWAAKDWSSRPIQHCLDLDIWLLECLADATEMQGRQHEAQLLRVQAKDARRERGLSTPADGLSSTLHDALIPSAQRLRSAPRHLY